MTSDTVSRRDYSSGVYPHMAIIRVRDSYEVVDVNCRIDAQHVRLTAPLGDELSGNTLREAKGRVALAHGGVPQDAIVGGAGGSRYAGDTTSRYPRGRYGADSYTCQRVSEAG